MIVYQSSSDTDYRYYPIEYPNRVLSSTAAYIGFPGRYWNPWIILKDKSKFICGVLPDYTPTSIKDVGIISVGF